MLWVDRDVAVPADGIAQLLRLSKPVVGGVYPRRPGRGQELAFDLEEYRPIYGPVAEPRRVGGLGLGFTLVEADVYRSLEARHGDEMWHRCIYGRSEAVSFFERCRDLDVEVWLDPRVAGTRAYEYEITARPGDAAQSIADDESVAATDPNDAPRVAIAMPLFEHVSPVALLSFIRTVRGAAMRGVLAGLHFTDGLIYDEARNTIVEEILSSRARPTHVLWIDSDMVLPANTLARLLAADREIVSGLYHSTRGTFQPAVFTLDPFAGLDADLAGMMRVDGFGLGCALVRTSVYEDMATVFGDRRWHVLSPGVGEDVYFFRRCKQMGLEAWLDASLRCGHVTDHPVTTADWAASRAGREGRALQT
jgi:endogenous inhibitor of DNA gyrase (YacG/DUF329 family)